MKLLQQIDSPADLRRLPLSDLTLVSAELRQFILEKIARIGGHLGAALGAVELTVALHYVFESPVDRIVWDVGHQAHGHKILTGRRDLFHTLKQEGGLSGFLKRSESPHDIFGAGHASTSISAALGLHEALRLRDGRGKVVAVIGDGGLTGGMAFEALNNAGALGGELIIVVNDNGMSISPNVGALSEWFSRKLVGQPMTRWRRRVRTFLEAFDGAGDDAIRFIEHMMDASKALMLTPGLLFEGLGFEYLGPIDGHDVAGMVDAFRDARQVGKPVVVHTCTTKGKGAPGVDEDRERKHAVTPFDLRSGESLAQRAGGTAASYTEVFGQTLCELAARDPRVVAITAAMSEGTGLSEFAHRFPSRFYDVGIAEQHAVTFAAGLAVEGFRPVVAIYSTFLQRAFDQVLHDVCLQELPVVFCMDRSGLVGADGATHHGVFDIGYLRMIPNMALLAPRNEDLLRHMLLTALRCGRPVALRYPRGAGIGGATMDPPQELPWGTAEVLRADGDDLLLLAVGPHVYTALTAAERLAAQGVATTVVDPRFLKPLDEGLLLPRLAVAKAVLTVEENSLATGFGSAVLELCELHGLRPRLRRIGIPDQFVGHGRPERLCAGVGLSADGLVTAYEQLLQQA